MYLYKLVFTFSPTLNETYYICAGKKADDIKKKSLKEASVTLQNEATVNTVLAKLKANLSAMDWKAIGTASLKEYAQTHVLPGTITITVCLSAGAFPSVVPICAKNGITEITDMTIIFVKQIAAELKAKGKIDAAQLATFNTAFCGLNVVAILFGLFSSECSVHRSLFGFDYG